MVLERIRGGRWTRVAVAVLAAWGGTRGARMDAGARARAETCRNCVGGATGGAWCAATMSCARSVWDLGGCGFAVTTAKACGAPGLKDVARGIGARDAFDAMDEGLRALVEPRWVKRGRDDAQNIHGAITDVEEALR